MDGPKTTSAKENESGSSDSSISSGIRNGETESLHGSTSTQEASKDKEEREKIELAKKESIAVFRLRVLVFVVLFCASIAVSIIVYFITAGALADELETQYEGAAKKLVDTFQDIIQTKLGAVSSLGVALIAHSIDHAHVWPFVSLSSFQQRAATTRSQSRALYITVCPMVEEVDRARWEEFVRNNSTWIAEGLDYQTKTGVFDFMKDLNANIFPDSGSPDTIWRYGKGFKKLADPGPGPYFPTWQISPIFDKEAVNLNALSANERDGILASFETGDIVINRFIALRPGGILSDNFDSAVFSLFLSTEQRKLVEYQGDPVSRAYFPVFNNFADNRKTVAVIVAWIHWATYFESSLPDSMVGIILVLSDGCGGVYTYEIDGEEVLFLGEGDLHDSKFNSMRRSSKFEDDVVIPDGTKQGLPLDQSVCQISIDVYPSQLFYESYANSTPVITTVSVVIIFLFTAFMFVLYDRLVERRQALVLRKAVQSTAIISSLFPETVRDRLMNTRANDQEESKKTSYVSPTSRVKGYLSGAREDVSDDQPIADLFPHCTVLFADIVGFTAWSSSRDPAQVFILLQTVYQAFDILAKRRKVFKVETIGDSYVAVTGLPEVQPRHAVIMARFAGECQAKMKEVASQLEYTLGPDTGDLVMRIGMHSGPVTAGVLRGDKARFQLFGDTVNTAARMESTGKKDRIQISVETQALLVEAGKSHWVTTRADAVRAKGKGTLKTFWLDPWAKKGAGSTGSGSDSDMLQALASSPTAQIIPSAKDPSAVLKQDRLVDWMVDILEEQMKKVLAYRNSSTSDYEPSYMPKEGVTALDEVAEVVLLPRFKADAIVVPKDVREIELDDNVHNQLRDYVAIIASTYHDNPFHNFEHACHVTMATNKFLRRVVTPRLALGEEEGKEASYGDIASKLHYYTHGINSDPLTCLAILFSALIHDVDHRGVSNLQLIKEEPEMGSFYKNKSVAEQNSLDIAWDLLMSEQFIALQRCLFTSEHNLKRFRQVVVNVVLATDIFDPDINGLRKKRWDRAFSECKMSHEELNDRRATIVIEHIMQASDVAHTMQHWHVYRKWNKRLFVEMYNAYKGGRMEQDPSNFWYQGEIAFFDKYVIPLAMKLKECNVFGVSSDECLNYAARNRMEWEDRGEEIVAEMVRELAGLDIGLKSTKATILQTEE